MENIIIVKPIEIIDKLKEDIIESNNEKSNSIISSDIETDVSKNNSSHNEIIISSLDGSSNNSDNNIEDNINKNNENIENNKTNLDKEQNDHKNESIIKYINNTLTHWSEYDDNMISNKLSNTFENIVNDNISFIEIPKLPLQSNLLTKKSLTILNENENANTIENENENANTIENENENENASEIESEINNETIINKTVNKNDNNNKYSIENIQHEIIKPSVVFSSFDVNKVKSFDYNSNSNSQKSFRSKSEVSYELFNKMQNNNNDISIENKNNKSPKKIRLAKNKHTEIDEVDFIYNKLQDYIRNINIDRSNYILIIVKAIEIVENYNGINNKNDKKNIVIKAFNRIVSIDLHLSEYDQTLFLTSISNIIEIIIIYSKTKYNNNYNQKKYFNEIEDIFLANSGQIVFSIIDKITTIIIKKQYNADKLLVNIGTITKIIMDLVNKYPYFIGSEKKIIVLQVIENLFKERIQYIIETSEEKKQNLIMAIDEVSILIDILIAVQKGKYKINKKQILEYNNKSFLDYICLRKSKNI